MKIFYKITFILISLVLLNACSGSDSSATVTDVTDSTLTVVTLSDLSTTVSENAKEGDLVGTLSITSTGDSAITAITLSGTGSTNFLVSTDGEITLNSDSSLDYETTTAYNLTAIATNSAGNSASVNVDILVTDVATNPFEIAKIQASDAEANDEFGNSVSISGDYIVVGARSEDTTAGTATDAGSAYLFKKLSDGTLTQIAKMQASDAQSSDTFGASVSISGDYIVVGANYEDTTDGNASNAGAAYIFKRNSDATNDVTQIAKIQASDAESNDNFGVSVSISGDYIVVGADKEDTTAAGAGAAYVFKRNSDTNVTEIAKIQASIIDSGAYFGNSVSIDGDYIVVGAYLDNSGFFGTAGAAYLFKINSDNNVTEIANIKSSDLAIDDNFGHSVSISGDYIVVGANYESTTAPEAGSAYVFKRNSDTTDDVTQIAKIQASDAGEEYGFGNSVSIEGDYIVVGSSLNSTTAAETGSAYIFKRNSDNTNDVTEIAKIQASDAELSDEFGISVSISGDNIVVGAHQEDTTASNAGSAYVFDLEPIEKPYIYNKPSSAISYDENLFNNNVFSFDGASPIGGVITYTVDGTDGSNFFFTDNNLFYISNADFEIPSDSDVLNDYNISITATDESNNAITLDMDIEVQDKYYFDLAKIQASDAEQDDYFGASVSISGDYIVVGANYEDTNVTNAGAAYVFKRNSDTTNDVTEIAKIQASDAQTLDEFGISVSISGDYIVVGAYREDTTDGNATDAGSAYIFKINSDTNVTQIAKIQASDAEQDDNFGTSVSISGDYIVVGANSEDTTATGAGSAYIFKRNSDTDVTEIAKIQASDAGAGDVFGYSVSISGNYIVVGAYQEDTTDGNVSAAGSAYVFKRNSDTDVTQIAKIQASDAEMNDWFGYSVSISGDYIVVGAYNEDTTASNAGAAYVFKRNSDDIVTESFKIQASDAQGNDYFGRSVSISGDNIVVGADGEDTTASGAGSAYIFVKDPNQASH